MKKSINKNMTNRKNKETIEAIFRKTERGFGFAEIKKEEKSENKNINIDDIFIPARYVNGALNGDLVEVLIYKANKTSNKNINSPEHEFEEDHTKKRREGEIIKIISREKSEIVGIYQESRNFRICSSRW